MLKGVLSLDSPTVSQDTDILTKIIKENSYFFPAFFFQVLIIQSELPHFPRHLNRQI